VAQTVPTCEPTDLVIGSAWSWDATYPDFPADDSWQLRYYLRGPDDLDLTWGTHVAAAASGPAFEVRVTAAQSGAVTTAGKYRLVGRVNKTGDDFDGTIVYNAHLLLLADPATAVNTKSTNRRMLDAIEAALLAGVPQSAEAKRITINNRTIEYRDTADLEGRRAHYMLLVAEEENPGAAVVHEWWPVRG
jgi:hypothetical protein